MLRTLCAHPEPIVVFRSGAQELADPSLAYLSSRPDGAVLGSPNLRDLSRVCCPDCMRRLRKRCMDWRGILALAHRGVIHVRGKDCVHPYIGLVIVRMISFPARESGQRARMAVPRHGRERSSS
jgi:hypothetical protein